MSFAILRTKKLKSFGSIAASSQHTHRERVTLNADSKRTHLNLALGATNTAELMAAIQLRLPEKRRKDAVLCIEYLVTASPEYFQDACQRRGYFNAALKWLNEKHGGANIICANLQLDEKTPHLVAYVLPITPDGRLSAKEYLGGREKLSSMQTNFHNQVGIPFGLERGIKGSDATHQKVKRFYQAMNTVVRIAPLSSVDHLAGALGIKTNRMARHEEELATLKQKNSVAGTEAMSALRKKINEINSDLSVKDRIAVDKSSRVVVLTNTIERMRRDAANEEMRLNSKVEKFKQEASFFRKDNEYLINRLRESLSSDPTDEGYIDPHHQNQRYLKRMTNGTL
ncbi:MobV family relaxase [Actimicrobium antarcticum]|uniref:Plasmid recombination enzyme n=1 Tax=Actimicrobium antarcticum TaxID=1051899 RepID=A0ABP7TDF7_9BURK